MGPAEDSAIYRDLMRLKPDGLTPNAWAVRAGVSRSVWADMRRHGNPSRRTLEKLLVAAGSSVAEFEALRIGPEPSRAPAGETSGVGEAQRRGWGPAPLPALPLVHSQHGGEWGGAGSRIELIEVRHEETVGTLPRPAALAGDNRAYAITIVGDSMWPRFRPGRRVAVSPRAPVAIGDDVVVELLCEPRDGGTDLVLIKELVARTGTYNELRQFNPDKQFRVDAGDVRAIHRVLGELF
jgi:hypothetical protein